MPLLNRLLTIAVDAVMGPMRAAPPIASLGIFSLLTAAGMLLVVKWTINRRTIERAKSRMQAAIFEMRLFNDDLPAVLRAALKSAGAMSHICGRGSCPS